MAGRLVSPTGWPLLMHDHPARAVGRAARDELHDLLAVIGTVQEKLGAVGRPAHIVGIMPTTSSENGFPFRMSDTTDLPAAAS